MFTGLVQQRGRLLASTGRDPMRLLVELERPLPDIELGESIAVEGVCLTVTEPGQGQQVAFDVSHETLARTTLGHLRPGVQLNLERCLTPKSLLGGHIVQGHVDGVGTVLQLTPVQGSWRLEIQPPAELLRYMVPLGSIAINGVSLTIVDLGKSFAVNLVPHTFQVTTLGNLKAGHRVNLEVDVLAKYVARLLSPYTTGSTSPSTAERDARLQELLEGGWSSSPSG